MQGNGHDLSQHLLERNKENHKIPQSGSWSLGQDMNLGPPEYKARMLITQP
jgi:hypothetical protein